VTGIFQPIAAFAGDSSHEPSDGSTSMVVRVPPDEGGGNGGGGAGGGGGNPPALAPATSLRSHPAKRTSKRLAKFVFSSNQSGSRFECKLDSKSFRSCRSPFKQTLEPGQHSFRVRAVSSGGLRDPSPARFS
jgi:hypothetical protein